MATRAGTGRVLRWLSFASVLVVCCGPARPRREGTTLRLDGLGGDVEYTSDCGGTHTFETHRQRGGSVEVTHTRGDTTVGGRAWLFRDRLEEAHGFEPSGQGTRSLMGLGGWGRWVQDRNAAFQFGGSVLATTDDQVLVPALGLSVGDLDYIWGELMLGPDNPALALNLISAGVAARGDAFRLRGGFTYNWRLLVARRPANDEGHGSGLQLGDENTGGYLDLEIDLPGRLGFGIGGVFGETQAGRVGISYRLGSD